MTGGPGSTERHYRRLLDKLKTRSNRIFVKAQMQNRTQEQRLKRVVNTLEKDRDLRIRKSHEAIWKVSSNGCPMPRLAKPESMPSYLSRPKATTLPTPAELATLLPKKRAPRQPFVAHADSESVAASKPPLKQYAKMSRRRLSTMTSDQVQIWHYRKALNDLEDTAEVVQEADGKDEQTNVASWFGENTETRTAGGGVTADGKWASPVAKTKSITNETGKTLMDDESTAAAEESVRMVMRKLGKRPQSSPMSYSRGTRAKKKRPQTSPGTDCATVAEQKLESNSNVLKTNYLDMYRGQLKNHVRRMTSKCEMPAPSVRIDEVSLPHRGERPKSSLIKTTLSRASTPAKTTSQVQGKFSSPVFTPESRGITNPGVKKRQSTLMLQTASSTSRSSPRRQMRRVSTRVMHATAFDTLLDEVQHMHSYKTFRRESLGHVDDIANLSDVEDGELFEEMKHCRYIRWAKADEAIIEEMVENEPLQNQLALLTLKYTPRVKSKKKDRGETH